MRAPLAIREDLLDELERHAVASGRSNEREALRLIALGLLDRIATDLAPLLARDQMPSPSTPPGPRPAAPDGSPP